ncbi:unnamed protein product [Adineta steineri]|uniref:DUF5672 domain-containing protein n=1 Tax=Adineta steineri TaxID=433720 RepID=A0A813QHM8_9BILA|nr:unnamed protein product [Adineta steineri]CAF1506235.1 unnamed protein product [Adineta steineri]
MPTKTFKLLTILVILIVCIVFITHIFQYHRRILNTNTTMSTVKPILIDFYPNIAVLVESRTTDLIVTVVHNVNYHIPSTWPIQIFHGKDNQDFIKNSTLAPLILSGKIILTYMDVVYGKSEGRTLLTDSKFWQRVRGEKILFFQIDSIMCSNSPHKITDYSQYDYIGAPWDPTWFSYSTVDYVGNGGFSLRSRNKTLALLALLPYNKRMPEDVWYGLHLRQVNGSVAPVNVAKTFAVESLYYERPLGVHRFNLPCPIREKLFQTCPESKIVMPEKCK